MNEILSEELDAVRAILMDGIEVLDDSEGGTTTIIISLHPLTANEDERSYVSLTLEISVSAGYPDAAPEVAVSAFLNSDSLESECYLSHVTSQGCKKPLMSTYILGSIIALFVKDFEAQRAFGQQRGRAIAQTVQAP